MVDLFAAPFPFSQGVRTEKFSMIVEAGNSYIDFLSEWKNKYKFQTIFKRFSRETRLTFTSTVERK